MTQSSGPQGRLLSTHRFMRWILWFLFTPFLAATAYHAWSTLPSRATSYPGEKAVAVLILLVAWGAFAGTYLKLRRQVVWVHEDGLRFRLPSGEGFVPWDGFAGYQFTRVVANSDAAIANALFDPVHLRKRTRFSFSGGGNNFVAAVIAKDGRAIAVNAGFSGMRKYCETLVERIDSLLLPDLMRRLRAGEAVSFGDLMLDSRGLVLADRQCVALTAIADVQVLDGQVWLSDGAARTSIGSVPNAYALQAAFRSLKQP